MYAKIAWSRGTDGMYGDGTIICKPTGTQPVTDARIATWRERGVGGVGWEWGMGGERA
eukprot:COSAG03_NODE_18008_length_363_cov_4.083333_2_plen_58_part_00